MQKDGKFLATIPFSGFYCSIHDQAFDHELEYAAENYADEAGEDIPAFLTEALFDAVDWGQAHETYAKEYAEAFLDWLGLTGSFESMTSPKYYNFETDRIFVEIDRDSLARAWRNTPRDELTEMAKRRFTSRDGFISHYDPDWRTWGRLTDWDHNQIGTLLAAFAEYESGSEWDSYDEHQLVEDLYVGTILSEQDAYCRVLNLIDYMIERAKRPVRTMAQWHAARRAEMRPFEQTPLGGWVNERAGS